MNKYLLSWIKNITRLFIFSALFLVTRSQVYAGCLLVDTNYYHMSAVGVPISASCPNGSECYPNALDGGSSQHYASTVGDLCTVKSYQCTEPCPGGSNNYVYQNCPTGEIMTCGTTAEANAQNKSVCTYPRTCNETYWEAKYNLPMCGTLGTLATCYWNCMCCPTGDTRVCTQGAQYTGLVYIDKTLGTAEKMRLQEACPDNPHDDIFVSNVHLTAQDTAEYQVWRLTCIRNTCRCSSAIATPTPTPWIRVLTRNAAGTPIPVQAIRRVSCSGTECVNSTVVSLNDDDYSFPKGPNSATHTNRGGRITLKNVAGDNLVVTNITMSDAGTSLPTCNGQTAAACYVWDQASWTTGLRRVTFIVATPTPTPTPPIIPTPTPVNLGAWSQVRGGDVYAANDVGSPIPESPPGPSPRVFVLPGGGGYPGIVTYGTYYDFDGTGATRGQDWVSATNWLVKESYPFVDYYELMLRRFGGEPSAWLTDTSATQPLYQYTTVNGSPDKTKPIPHYYGGDLTTSGDWTVANGEKLVIFVRNNLTIGGTVASLGSGFIAFIVGGDITIDPSVGTTFDTTTAVVRGVYITSGTFYTGNSSSLNHERFVARGVFVARNFALERNLELIGKNTEAPAELFVYDPQILITMPDAMRDSPVVWQEVAP